MCLRLCVFTPCLERLVVASPCLVHWGAAICSPSGKRGVWHHIKFMTLLILSATATSEPQAVHATDQKRAITLNTSCFCQVPSLSKVFMWGCCGGDLLVQVRIYRIISQSTSLTERNGDVMKRSVSMSSYV